MENRGRENASDLRTNSRAPGSAASAADSVGPSRLRVLVLVGVTTILLALCTLITVPFLPAITWAVALAIIAWPLHVWVGRHVTAPSLAAGISAGVVSSVIFVVGVWLVYQLTREAVALTEVLEEESQLLRETPFLGIAIEWFERFGGSFEIQLRNAVKSFVPDGTILAQGSVATGLQILVALFMLFYLFRDRRAFLLGVSELLPLSAAETDRILGRAADSVHANLYATVATSATSAVGGSLMFWLLGLPSPVFWGVVIFILSVLPVVGSAMVWAPAALYLATTGRWLMAAALVGWGLLTWAIVDNILYVHLAGDRMRIHPVPTLIAFLGGLAVFGISGVIIGPAILAVTLAVLESWNGSARNICS